MLMGSTSSSFSILPCPWWRSQDLLLMPRLIFRDLAWRGFRLAVGKCFWVLCSTDICMFSCADMVISSTHVVIISHHMPFCFFAVLLVAGVLQVSLALIIYICALPPHQLVPLQCTAYQILTNHWKMCKSYYSSRSICVSTIEEPSLAACSIIQDE